MRKFILTIFVISFATFNLVFAENSSIYESLLSTIKAGLVKSFSAPFAAVVSTLGLNEERPEDKSNSQGQNPYGQSDISEQGKQELLNMVREASKERQEKEAEKAKQEAAGGGGGAKPPELPQPGGGGGAGGEKEQGAGEASEAKGGAGSDKVGEDAKPEQGLNAGKTTKIQCITKDGEKWEKVDGWNASEVTSVVSGGGGGYLEVPKGTPVPEVGFMTVQQKTIGAAKSKKMAERCRLESKNGQKKFVPITKPIDTKYTQTGQTDWKQGIK